MSAEKLTISRIAELAGVSKSTVSRVLNDYPHIREEIRERVLQVVEDTGYQRNRFARMLVTQQSNMMGLVIPSGSESVFTDPYYPALTRGVTRFARDNDFTVALFLCESEQEAHDTISSILSNRLLDGIIVTADNKDNSFETQLIESQLPFVFVGKPQYHERVHYIDADNFEGGVLATEYLISRGYERIAIIGSDKNRSADDRYQGYQHALEKHGRTLDDSLVAFGNYSMESGERAMHSLLPAKPDAVFITSDTMAIGAMRALQDAAIGVPDDIGVVGYDDLSPAIQANPQLTTIQQPIQQTGELAVETLLQIIQNPKRPLRQLKLPVELITRDSTR